MNEGDIKAAVLQHIRAVSPARARPVVTAEFTLGSNPVRADLAILGDEFIGVEIKSDGDSLRRLTNQIAAYNECFERTILVVANRHLRHLRSETIEAAAVWSFDLLGNLTEVRPARVAKATSAAAFVDMMTADERRRYLGGEGNGGALKISAEEARRAFFLVFAERYGETSKGFWKATSRRRIRPNDLPTLSRFSEKRSAMLKIAQDREAFWDQWAQENSSSVVV